MKKTSDDIKRFSDWSKKWKDGRKNISPETILKLWTNEDPMPRRWERELWEGELGYRKRSANKGEQCTEDDLFNRGGKGFELVYSSNQSKAACRVEAIYHNMPLANQRKGQVLADAFGVLGVGKSVRPIFIEVKVTANNPWFALVENLQQIRLARACAKRIQTFVHNKTDHKVGKGVWGLILAPNKYYKKHADNLALCRPLLAALKEKTNARVAFGISDFLKDGKIEVIDSASNWSV